MLLLVIWLFIETREAVKREKFARQDGLVKHTLRRERCIYAIIIALFGLSYMGRYIFNVYLECVFEWKNFFNNIFSLMLVYLFEGMSMGVLMLFHLINFKQGKPILSRDDRTSIMINMEEFDIEEVISS